MTNSSGVGTGRGTVAGDIGVAVAEVIGGDDWEKFEMPERATS